MTKEKFYEVGKRINDKWIIVSILYTRKQNKKLVCMHIPTGIFKEGWIWDFTRDIVKPTKNRNPLCYLSKIQIKTKKDELLDIHYEYSNNVYYKTSYLSREEYSILQGYREGAFNDMSHILKKFDYLLSNDYDKHGHSRRNENLAMLIATTYQILYLNNRL